MRTLRVHARLEDPRGHHVRVRGLRPSDEPDLRHRPGEDPQALQDLVPRDLRDLDAPHRHLGQRPSADHGLRLLRDGLDVAAQAARGDGALRQQALGPCVQADETLVGGKGGPHKELVLVAAEANGRVRLAHVANDDTGTCERFVCDQIAADAHVVTDGHAGYNEKSLGERSHSAVVQTKAERRDGDAVQACHWTASLLKRRLFGTHAGAVSEKHLQAYLDELAFRHNRRKTDGVCRIAARVIESLVARPPLTMRQLVERTRRCRWFTSPLAAIA